MNNSPLTPSSGEQFDELSDYVHKEHLYCAAHSEGQYCCTDIGAENRSKLDEYIASAVTAAEQRGERKTWEWIAQYLQSRPNLTVEKIKNVVEHMLANSKEGEAR